MTTQRQMVPQCTPRAKQIDSPDVAGSVDPDEWMPAEASPNSGVQVSHVQGDATNIITSVWGAVPLAATADICDAVKERFLIRSVTCEIVFQPLHPVTCAPLHESINCNARETEFTPVFHQQN